MNEALQAVAEGRVKRLMINMPPRHGKTEMVSRRFPAYMLGQHPDWHVIGCSYSATLAHSVNRDIQRVMTSKAYAKLFPDTQLNGSENMERDGDKGSWLRNSEVFEIVGHGGSYRGTGIGGPITGQGMHLGIVDDPFKNAEEAESETIRQKVWDWWNSTFLTRDEGDAAIICTFTRWHEDDLAGRILAQAEETGEEWVVIDLPAVKDSDDDELDPRAIGDALWPDKYDLKKLKAIEKRLGPRWWDALYQQNPTGVAGNILLREYWQYWNPRDPLDLNSPPPSFDFVVQVYDTAHGKKKQNDPSVCATIGVAGRKAWLLDIWLDRVQFPELKAQARALYYRDSPTWLLIENKSSGQDLIPELLRARPPLPIWKAPDSEDYGITPPTDKIARAHGVSSMLRDGMMILPVDAVWLAAFLDETAGFPFKKHDDQVDVITMFLAWWRDHVAKPQAKLIHNMKLLKARRDRARL